MHQTDVNLKRHIPETSGVDTSDISNFYTQCAPTQLGMVGPTSDVCGFYVFVLVTNTAILSWDDVNFAHK